ncbi:MAG: hypothetical protein ACHREM_15120 [Polyangiales bacterium]
MLGVFALLLAIVAFGWLFAPSVYSVRFENHGASGVRRWQVAVELEHREFSAVPAQASSSGRLVMYTHRDTSLDVYYWDDNGVRHALGCGYVDSEIASFVVVVDGRDGTDGACRRISSLP